MADIRAPESSEKQTQLVRRYCAEAERLLNEATDLATALQLKESLCEQFQKECDSSLVVTATRQYLDVIIKERWKVHNGANDTTVGSH
jgi:hypothetical protein